MPGPERQRATAAREAALAFLAWSRVWSPLPSEAARSEAWEALGLPAAYPRHRTDFWSTFHAGVPSPRVPLLLHAALDREGAAVREDWMRVMAHLGLRWGDRRLPPDHLGADCEIYACAIEQEEGVLVAELRRRYLLPWCEVAASRLDASALAALPARFAADLAAVPAG
jgi:8-oxo-dGTP pyrophosphatase MutT (NUDIX family)